MNGTPASAAASGLRSWVVVALALACVSLVIARAAAGAEPVLRAPAVTFLAVAIPTLLAPLFWPAASAGPGRTLLASLLPLPASLLILALAWLLRGVPPSPAASGLALACAVLMLGALHLAATLIERLAVALGAATVAARLWSAWLCTAVLWLAAAAPLWLGPAIDLVAGARPQAPAIALAASPLGQLASATGYDLLRNQWVYAHTALGAMQIDYPRTGTFLVVLLVAGAALSAASVPFGRRPKDTGVTIPQSDPGE